MKKVTFHTLGCKVNQYETEAMEEMFKKNGYDIVENNDMADIYIINTCTVTNMGDRKSRQFIRRARKINDKAVIAAVGCYSQVSPEEVEKIEEVDIIIGTTNRDKIVELCEYAMENYGKINIVEDIRMFKEFEEINIDDVKSRTRAYIKVQDGCNQYCSYCIIPYARGPVRSRKLDDIIEESIRLRDKGFKELILTGIHVESYGKDLDNIELIDVIEEVAKIDGIERIRLSSVEPRLITREFMERALATKKLCDHFHLSLQSGSDTVLKRMNRKYNTELYMENVELIREYMPEAGITTDIIVGFPGETEEEFNETLEFVKEIGFSRIHVFKYSPREGTPAAKMDNQIDGIIKSERSEKLIKIGDEIANDINNNYIGSEIEVLFEEDNNSNFEIEGYTTNYIRVKTKDLSYKGKIAKVKIEDIENDTLVGKIIN